MKGLKSLVGITLKILSFFIFVTGLTAVVNRSTFGIDYDVRKARTCPGDVGGTGNEWDLPWPFTTNQKVELADGEYYVLIGKLRKGYRDYYFEVDLELHPWLGHSKRKQNPYYLVRVESDFQLWEKAINKKLKVLIEAVGVIQEGNEFQGPSYEIILKPVAKPIQLARKGAKNPYPNF